jgi:hypothetical protein
MNDHDYSLRPGIVRLAVASFIGTTLKWFDFTVYNVMAPVVFSSELAGLRLGSL